MYLFYYYYESVLELYVLLNAKCKSLLVGTRMEHVLHLGVHVPGPGAVCLSGSSRGTTELLGRERMNLYHVGL